MNNFDNRKFVISFLIVLIGLVFIFRLAYMQLIDDQWKDRAAQISEDKIIVSCFNEYSNFDLKSAHGSGRSMSKQIELLHESVVINRHIL